MNDRASTRRTAAVQGMTASENPMARFSAAILRLEPFAHLPREYQQALLGASQVVCYEAGSTIVGRDNPSVVLFLLQGTLMARKAEGQPLRYDANTVPCARPVYEPGEPLEISAVRESFLLRIPHAVYIRQLSLAVSAAPSSGAEVQYLEDWDQMDGLERALTFGALSHVPPGNIHQIMSRLEETTVAPGTVVFEQDRPADGYYVVKSGTAEVFRQDANGRRYRLAIKVPGDAFGEEALLIDGVRSATVSMLTSGSLLRISTADFCTYVREPLIHRIDEVEAREMLEGGARWVDIRELDERTNDTAPPDALKIPLSLLRIKRRSLPNDVIYLLYGDSLKNEELACYLLSECGLSACVLKGRPACLPQYRVDEVVVEDVEEIVASAAVAPPLSLIDHIADDELAPVPSASESEQAARRQSERARYDQLLAERTVQLKQAAERAANAVIAKRDAEMRAQVLQKMRVLRAEKAQLLEEASTLAARAAALQAELDAQRAAFEAKMAEERAALEAARADLEAEIARRVRAGMLAQQGAAAASGAGDVEAPSRLDSTAGTEGGTLH